MYEGHPRHHARTQPASCKQQQNTTFISSHACSRGDDIEDTPLLHKAHIKACASCMPVHSRHHVINNKTLHLSVVMHATVATAHETHCSCTRHVPRPCPCATDVLKSRTDHLSALTHAAEVMTQETHYCCTRHVPRARASSMPVHNRCNEIKNKTQHLSAVTHATKATTQETHYNSTRHVPRCVPRACPCTTGVMKSRTKHNIYQQSHMQQRRRHKRHTAIAQGMY